MIFVGEERGLQVGLGDEIVHGDADVEGAGELGAFGAAGPGGAEGFEQAEGVLAGGEAGFHAPAGVGEAGEVLIGLLHGGGLLASQRVADGDVQGGGVEVLHSQAHSGFVEELVGDRPGAFGGAVLGGEDVGVAEGFLDAGVYGGAIVAGVAAAEPVVEAVAPDGVPEGVHGGTIQGEQFLHGGDSLGVEADLGAGADPGKVA